MKSAFLTIGVLLLSEVAVADTQVSNTDLRMTNPNPYYGRSDGVAVETDTKATVAVGNGDIAMCLNRRLCVEEFEDFLGGFIVPEDSATVVNKMSPWSVEDTSAAGTPTYALVADADNGHFKMTLAANNEAENLTFNWMDELNIDTDFGPVITFSASIAVLPSGATEVITFGLGSAQNDDENAVTNHAWFKLEYTAATAAGDGNDLLIESDDGTTDDNDNDTGVDLVAGTWYDFKIDCSTPTDCDFFYASTLGGDWTELLATTAFSIGADAATQPYVQIQKDSGTSVHSITLDYVHVYWLRKAD